MGLADLFAVTSVSNLPGLSLLVLLAHTIHADQIWGTAVGAITQVALTAERAIALFQHIGVQRYCRKVGKSGSLKLPFVDARLLLDRTISRGWKIFRPFEVTACGERLSENVFQSSPRGIIFAKDVDARCSPFIQSREMRVKLCTMSVQFSRLRVLGTALTQGIPRKFKAFP